MELPPKYKPPDWAVTPCGPPAASLSLEVSRDGELLDTINIGIKSCYVVGRNEILSDILFEHASLSRQHAAILHAPGGKVRVIDLNSTHGTFLDGKRLQPNSPLEIAPGSTLRFGSSSRSCVLRSSSSQALPHLATAQSAASAVDRDKQLVQNSVVTPREIPRAASGGGAFDKQAEGESGGSNQGGRRRRRGWDVDTPVASQVAPPQASSASIPPPAALAQPGAELQERVRREIALLQQKAQVRAREEQDKQAKTLADKKKLLWGSKKRDAPEGGGGPSGVGAGGGGGKVGGGGGGGGGGSPGVGGHAGGASGQASAPASASGMTAVWATAQLGDASRENKFRKLMGIKDNVEPQQAAAAAKGLMKIEEQQELARNLENQFASGIRRQTGDYRNTGLGSR